MGGGGGGGMQPNPLLCGAVKNWEMSDVSTHGIHYER